MHCLAMIEEHFEQAVRSTVVVNIDFARVDAGNTMASDACAGASQHHCKSYRFPDCAIEWKRHAALCIRTRSNEPRTATSLCAVAAFGGVRRAAFAARGGDGARNIPCATCLYL